MSYEHITKQQALLSLIFGIIFVFMGFYYVIYIKEIVVGAVTLNILLGVLFILFGFGLLLLYYKVKRGHNENDTI